MRFTLKIGRLVIFDIDLELFALNDPAPIIIQLADDDDDSEAHDDRHIL